MTAINIEEKYLGAMPTYDRDIDVTAVVISSNGTTNMTDRQEARDEAMELAIICAKDIVSAWPEMTMRTLANMTKRIDTLRQALEEAAK
jgi:hypothetical protein